MNRTLITTLVTLFVAFNGLPINAQWATIPEKYEYKNIEKKIKLRKRFDIERFNKHRDDMGEYTFKLEDGMVVNQSENYDQDYNVIGYFENRKYPNSPYEYYSEYDSEGNIVTGSASFYSITIGTAVSYDKQGNPHVTEDFDAPYKGSIEDLKAKMKREYNVDITDMNSIRNVYRRIDEGEPFYEVQVKVPNSKDRDAYLIDANTGKTLVTRRVKFRRVDIHNPDPKEETMVEEYRRTKKEREEEKEQEAEKKKSKGFWESLFE